MLLASLSPLPTALFSVAFFPPRALYVSPSSPSFLCGAVVAFAWTYKGILQLPLVFFALERPASVGWHSQALLRGYRAREGQTDAPGESDSDACIQLKYRTHTSTHRLKGGGAPRLSQSLPAICFALSSYVLRPLLQYPLSPPSCAPNEHTQQKRRRRCRRKAANRGPHSSHPPRKKRNTRISFTRPYTSNKGNEDADQLARGKREWGGRHSFLFSYSVLSKHIFSWHCHT